MLTAASQTSCRTLSGRCFWPGCNTDSPPCLVLYG